MCTSSVCFQLTDAPKPTNLDVSSSVSARVNKSRRRVRLAFQTCFCAFTKWISAIKFTHRSQEANVLAQKLLEGKKRYRMTEIKDVLDQ